MCEDHNEHPDQEKFVAETIAKAEALGLGVVLAVVPRDDKYDVCSNIVHNVSALALAAHVDNILTEHPAVIKALVLTKLLKGDLDKEEEEAA